MDDRSTFSYKSPSVFGRIAVAWKLIVGLRGQELQSVGSWIERNYAESGRVVGFLRFVGWAVKSMLVDIPNALVGVTFAKPMSKVSYWLAADNPVKNHPMGFPTEREIAGGMRGRGHRRRIHRRGLRVPLVEA